MPRATTTKREIERKYDVDGPVLSSELGGLLGDCATTPPQQQRLSATYYDTPTLGLLRAGVTLRRRAGGHDAGWHLKLPAEGEGRDEIQLPLGRAAAEPPTQLVELTHLYARGARLAPVAQIDTDRRRWLMRDTGGRELAELAEDEVHAHTLGSQTRAESWREVEVELGEHAKPKLLDRFERELLAAGARPARTGSKLARALAEELNAAKTTAPRPRTGKPGSAGEALLTYLQAQAVKLRSVDPQVRQDAPDALHQMRVTARRMRSGLQACRRVLDREATRPLVEELRWLGRALNNARDAEVVEEELTAGVAALPAELVLGPVQAQITRTLQRRRSQGQLEAIEALNSDRYLELHHAIDTLLADPPFTRRARRAAHKELPRAARKAWRRTAARMNDAHAATGDTDRAEALHETRKAAKRLRYTVEIARPAVGKPAKRMRRHLKHLHTVLGEHQDAVVACPLLRELAAQAQIDGGNGFTYGILHARQLARASQAEQKIPGAWRELRRPRNLKWLR
jgi:CHAD domain-containing protein